MAEDEGGSTPTVSSVSNPEASSSFWHRCRIRIGTEITVKRVAVCFIATLFVIWAWDAVTKDVVTITVFSAPKILEEEGLSGLFLTNRVADRVAVLETSAFSTDHHRFQPAASDDIPELELPETKLSLKSIVQFLRTVIPEQFVRATRIDGDAAISGATVVVVARIHSRGRVAASVLGPFSCPVASSEQCTDKIAEGIVAELDPVVMANYWYQLDETPDRALEFANRRMSLDSPQADGLNLFVGSVLMDKGQLSMAKAIFESVLNRNPRNVSALLLIGRYYELVEDYGSALRYYRAARENGKAQPEALNNVAYRYIDDGDLNSAMALFDDALRYDPRYTWAHRGRADVFARLGARSKALGALRDGIASSPNDLARSAAKDALASFLVDENNPQAGLLLADEAIKLNPGNPDPFKTRGKALLLIGDEVGSRKAYERALEIDPGKGLVYQSWASDLAERKRYNEALEIYALANRTDPWSPFPLAESGRLLIGLGKFDEGADFFRRALEVAHFRFTILNRWGLAFQAAGDSAKALTPFQSAHREVDIAPIRANIADAEYGANRFADGDRDYETAVAQSRYPARELVDWGNHLMDRGELGRAQNILRRAVTFDEMNTTARLRLAISLERSGESSAAMKELRLSIKNAIYPSGVLAEWADNEVSKGRSGAAIEYLRQSISLDPENSSARVALARQLFRIGWDRAAELELSAAVEHGVTPAAVHVDWGNILYDNRRFGDAEKQYLLAAELTPSFIDAWEGIIRSRVERKAPFHEVKSALLRLINANPNDPRVYASAANYYRSVERYPEAIEAYDATARRFPWLDEPLLAKGELLVQLNQLADARQSFESAFRRRPNLVASLVRGANAFSSRGAFSLALEYYDEALQIDPNSSDVLAGKAGVLVQTQDRSLASKYCDGISGTMVNMISAYMSQADVCVELGVYDKALQKYTIALSREPMRLDLYTGKARVYLLMGGEENNALRILWKAQANQLDNAELHALLGEAYCNTKQFPLAEPHFQRALNGDPNSAWLPAWFGNCLANQQKWQAASQMFGTSLRISADYLPLYGSIDRAPLEQVDLEYAVNRLRDIAPHLAPDVQLTLAQRIKRFPPVELKSSN